LVRYWPEAPKALSESSGFQILISSLPGDYQKSRQSRTNNITKAGAFVKLRRRFHEAPKALSESSGFQILILSPPGDLRQLPGKQKGPFHLERTF
jgi:hypothetical protein